jgi:hypothetical protein
MRRSEIFYILALLFISTLLVGCGGSKSSGRIESTDYFGLEIGAQLTYHIEAYDSEETPPNLTAQITQTVLRELPDNRGVFQTRFSSPTYPDIEPWGDFIEKRSSGYYYRGDWEIEDGNYDPSPYPGPPYPTIIVEPVPQNFESDWWGPLVRQESVNVPAGTFNNAWHFVDEYEDPYSTWSFTEEFWFVPYVGIVQSTLVEEENGATIYSETVKLASIRYGVNTSGMFPPGTLSSSGATAKSLDPSDSTQKHPRFGLRQRRK